MLSIPNYYRRKVNQNSKKSKITLVNMAVLSSPQTINAVDSWKDVTLASPTRHSQ